MGPEVECQNFKGQNWNYSKIQKIYCSQTNFLNMLDCTYARFENIVYNIISKKPTILAKYVTPQKQKSTPLK